MIQRRPLQLVVLVAGRGRRLQPVTATRPKPMVEAAGKPLLAHLLQRARAAGVRRATLVTGYLSQVIVDYFGDGGMLGLAVDYVFQPTPAGTASAVELARESVGDAPFLLSWGDVVVRTADYRAVGDLFASRPCTAVTAVNWVDDPAAGAAVYVDGDRVVELVEKPSAGTARTHWNQAGLFALGPDTFDHLAQVKPSPRGEREFTSALAAMVDAGKPVLAYPLPKGRVTITRPSDIPRASMWLERHQ